MERRRFKQKHSKVRSGCSTCKKRHLKCDETRPTCLRCSKGGYKCEGYIDPPNTWIFEYSHEKSSTSQELSIASNEPLISIANPSYSADYPTPVTLPSDLDDDKVPSFLFKRTSDPFSSFSVQPGSPFRTAVEQRALKRFCEIISPLLTRYSDEAIWSEAIPQNAWTNDAVKYSLVAATLVEEGSHTNIRQPARSRKALSYMNLAIRALMEQKPSTVIILLTSLILHFLETIGRNADVAGMHLQSSLKIISEYKQRMITGEEVNPEHSDFIIRRMEPCVAMAIQFHQSSRVNAPAGDLDHHSLEAYELRKNLTKPGIVDAFRNITDARNNLGTMALKLSEAIARAVATSPVNATSQIAEPHNTLACRIQISQPDYQDAISRYQHFWRLLKPMYDHSKPEARMLLIHFRILKLLFRDVTLEEVASPSSLPAEESQPENDQEELLTTPADDLLSSAISCAANPTVQHADNYKIELGLIPPLFYLATNNTLQCQPNLRRKAIHCLQYLFGERREGAWTGAQAGRIAAEIFNLQEDLKEEFVYNGGGGGVSFEVFRHPTGSLGPELWMFYHTTKSPGSMLPMRGSVDQGGLTGRNSMSRTTSREGGGGYEIEGGRECQVQMRLCVDWSADEILGLPKDINELMRNCGYQGYFQDVVVDDEVTFEIAGVDDTV